VAQREPSAAAALYPNLPSSERPEQTQTGPRLSEAMWPRAEPKPLSPQELREAWRDHLMQLAGLRRKR
jgi:hypothetical protein